MSLCRPARRRLPGWHLLQTWKSCVRPVCGSCLLLAACAAKSLQLIEKPARLLDSFPRKLFQRCLVLSTKPVRPSDQVKQATHTCLACFHVYTTGCPQCQPHAAAAAAYWRLANRPACGTHTTQQQTCIAAQAAGGCWLMQARDKRHVGHSVPKQQRQQQEQEQKPETAHDRTCSCSSSWG